MRLEDKISQFESDLFDMADRVRKTFALSLAALEADDKELALDVIERDDYINDADENINDSAIEILSLMQPVAKDLRLVVGGIKISTDLERIGDYAKNIGRFIIKSKDPKAHAAYIEDLHSLGEIFLKNFDNVIDVMKGYDVKGAYDASEQDAILDDAFKQVMIRYADQSVELKKFPWEVTGILRNIERAGDHSKNICEHVIYIVKGRHIDFG